MSAAIGDRVKKALEDLLREANLKKGRVLVVGCSTSEVIGKKIGTSSNIDVARDIYSAIRMVTLKNDIFPAFQCCEHLNRCLVVEERAMEKYGWEEVTVIPKADAGGALASIAFEKLDNPVVVEAIKAHAGMDIGDTFIGMHLSPVAVPVRGSVDSIGGAHLTMARTRSKLVGGERASYRRD